MFKSVVDSGNIFFLFYSPSKSQITAYYDQTDSTVCDYIPLSCLALAQPKCNNQSINTSTPKILSTYQYSLSVIVFCFPVINGCTSSAQFGGKKRTKIRGLWSPSISMFERMVGVSDVLFGPAYDITCFECGSVFVCAGSNTAIYMYKLRCCAGRHTDAPPSAASQIRCT